MATNRDFTKPDLQILLDQINEDNTSSLTTSLVTFGAVAVDGGGIRNSNITATSTIGSGYSGNVAFKYDRVDLATIPGARSTTFQAGDATHISDLIEEINTAYQLNLTVADFVDVVIPAFPGDAPHETQQITLTASATSLIYRGALVLTVDANDIPLSSVITTTTLNGLYYVQPV